MSEIPEAPSLEVAVAELAQRLEALERMGLTPRLPGELAPWTGYLSSLTGEVEVKPGWLLCNGQAVLRDKWPELFDEYQKAGLSRFGTGDGATTFGLPNLLGRAPFAKNTSGALATVGATGGAETVTLTEAQLPSHTHTATPSLSTSAAGAHAHTFESGANWALNVRSGSADFSTGAGSYQFYRDQSLCEMDQAGSHSHTITGTVSIGSTGSGSSHQNLPPYQIVEAWIVYAGRKAS